MIDNQKISECLKSYFEEKGIQQKDIASRLGVSQAAVSALLNGKPFGKRVAEKWGNEFGIKPSWLITGEGDMLKQTSNRADTILQNSDGFRLVPMYNIDARGGFGTNDEIDSAEYVVDYVPFKDAKAEDICVPVVGNSMAPTFCAGSVVLLHRIERWQEFLELGQVYMIVLADGRRIIKELKVSREDKRNNYLCVSHNPDFEPVELPKNMISEVFLVRAVYAKTSM